jgi:protein-arginine kinase activator protein McsA
MARLDKTEKTNIKTFILNISKCFHTMELESLEKKMTPQCYILFETDTEYFQNISRMNYWKKIFETKVTMIAKHGKNGYKVGLGKCYDTIGYEKGQLLIRKTKENGYKLEKYKSPK